MKKREYWTYHGEDHHLKEKKKKKKDQYSPISISNIHIHELMTLDYPRLPRIVLTDVDTYPEYRQRERHQSCHRPLDSIRSFAMDGRTDDICFDLARITNVWLAHFILRQAPLKNSGAWTMMIQ